MPATHETRVEIGFEEFIKLAFFMWACHEAEYDIGDCGLHQNWPTMLADIQANSKITLSLDQLDNLTYHFKQAVLFKFNPAKKLEATPDEYQSMMAKIQKWIPHYISRNHYGELLMKGYSHQRDVSQVRKAAFRKRITREDREFLKED